ncbi:MAG TPA: phosphoglucomutase/phosphomannomutase family protein, partial [Geobacterales bacterium]|nr:phosphoglucomutase/phosphomannomutase family protein [Geobacterales bacterium]
VIAGAGIKALLCRRDTPTPVIAHAILHHRAAGALNFTASHNPAEYNGIKFSPSWGGPALPETTKDIERRANEMSGEVCYTERHLDEALRNGLLMELDPQGDYLSAIERLVDFDAIARLGCVAINPLYGTGRGYLQEPLQRRHMKVRSMNTHLDPNFGGFPPEPAEKYIQEFMTLVRDDSAVKLGLATDGDADRFGIVDEDGSYIEPNYIIALLLDYLLRVRKMTGGAARSVATSHLVDAVAREHGIELFETPVGFKYIGELISHDKIVIGGEESAGLTIKGHVPEKDGILACFLVAEMVAREGMPVKQLLERLYSRVGRFITRRENIALSQQLAEGYAAQLASPPSSFAGQAVKDVVTLDGSKFILADGSWLLFRKSGTEPVVRLYGESSTPETLAAIMAAGRAFITG